MREHRIADKGEELFEKKTHVRTFFPERFKILKCFWNVFQNKRIKECGKEIFPDKLQVFFDIFALELTSDRILFKKGCRIAHTPFGELGYELQTGFFYLDTLSMGNRMKIFDDVGCLDALKILALGT